MKDMWLLELESNAFCVIDLRPFDVDYEKAIIKVKQSLNRRYGQISERIIFHGYLSPRVLILNDKLHDKIDGEYAIHKVTDEVVYVIFRGSESDIVMLRLAEDAIKNVTKVEDFKDVKRIVGS